MHEVGLVTGGTARARAETGAATTTGGFSAAAVASPISISEPNLNLPHRQTYTPTTWLDRRGTFSTRIPNSETELIQLSTPRLLAKPHLSFRRRIKLARLPCWVVSYTTAHTGRGPLASESYPGCLSSPYLPKTACIKSRRIY